MSIAAPPRLMTTEEFLALPDDGVERWLIDGRLREKGRPGDRTMTVRNRFHSRIMVRTARFLDEWLDTRPAPRGCVLCGEAGVRFGRDPENIDCIDVVYVAAEVMSRQTNATTLIDGLPVLAVEILSPSETQEEIDEKIDAFLRAGVALVWVIDPHDQTVTIYRPGRRPELVNTDGELSGDPHLPGFSVAVRELFV